MGRKYKIIYRGYITNFILLYDKIINIKIYCLFRHYKWYTHENIIFFHRSPPITSLIHSLYICVYTYNYTTKILVEPIYGRIQKSNFLLAQTRLQIDILNATEQNRSLCQYGPEFSKTESEIECDPKFKSNSHKKAP